MRYDYLLHCIFNLETDEVEDFIIVVDDTSLNEPIEIIGTDFMRGENVTIFLRNKYGEGSGSMCLCNECLR